jgi:hypothetical protein
MLTAALATAAPANPDLQLCLHSPLGWWGWVLALPRVGYIHLPLVVLRTRPPRGATPVAATSKARLEITATVCIAVTMNAACHTY